MLSLKKRCVAIASRLFANRLSQRMLQRTVVISNYFMGIGSGADTASSGEAVVLADLDRYGKPPFVIFDVGANQGQFLRLAIDHVDKNKTQIHSFEPSTAAFSLLSQSYSSYNGVRLNNFGLGASCGEAVLYFDKPGSGLGSLTQSRLEHFGINHGEHEMVQINTIDTYCEMNGIEEITLLKIDVEGHELNVLRGATKMMTKRAIGAIAFEFGGCNIDTRTFLQDYWYLFRDCGMKLFRVTPSGYLYPIDSYQEILEQMVTTNFVVSRPV